VDYYQYALLLIATAAPVETEHQRGDRFGSFRALLLRSNHSFHEDWGHDMTCGPREISFFRHAKSVRWSLAAQTLAKGRFVEKALFSR
jgi:hypothetical protein